MTVLGSADFTRVVRADLVRSGLLYAGTETGIYVSFDYGATWQLLQLDKQKGERPLVQAHLTGQNQEPSFNGLNRHGTLKYSWAVGLGPFKPGQIVRQ